jgi:hypothetical protein
LLVQISQNILPSVFSDFRDEALPDLQTAIDQKDAHRNCTVRVRKACLAGVVA